MIFGSKKKLLLAIGVGVASFGVSLAVALLSSGEEAQIPPVDQPDGKVDQPLVFDNEGIDNLERLTPTEQQLRVIRTRLVEKVESYNQKMRSLRDRENRIKLAAEALEGQIKELKTLQTKLTASTSAWKRARGELDAMVIKIVQAEMKNCQRSAQIFAEMDPEIAGQTLSRMFEDRKHHHAVLVLKLMATERAAAILDSIVDAAIRARLADGMRKMTVVTLAEEKAGELRAQTGMTAGT